MPHRVCFTFSGRARTAPSAATRRAGGPWRSSGVCLTVCVSLSAGEPERPLQLLRAGLGVHGGLQACASPCVFYFQRASQNGPFSWYAQGWGSREVELTPADMCLQECSPILVLLHAGDISESRLVAMGRVHTHLRKLNSRRAVRR